MNGEGWRGRGARRSESKEGEGVSWVGTKRFCVVCEAKQSASMLHNEPFSSLSWGFLRAPQSSLTRSHRKELERNSNAIRLVVNSTTDWFRILALASVLGEIWEGGASLLSRVGKEFHTPPMSLVHSS